MLGIAWEGGLRHKCTSSKEFWVLNIHPTRHIRIMSIRLVSDLSQSISWYTLMIHTWIWIQRIWSQERMQTSLLLEQRWDEKVGLGLLVQRCRIKEERLQQDKKTKLEERKMAQGKEEMEGIWGWGFQVSADFKSNPEIREYKVPWENAPSEMSISSYTGESAKHLTYLLRNEVSRQRGQCDGRWLFRSHEGCNFLLYCSMSVEAVPVFHVASREFFLEK